MENASKALIIAGSILLSILIIALGMYIFGQAGSSTDTSQLSALEISAFNGKFDKYKGKQNGTQVNALLDALLANARDNDSISERPNVTFTDVKNADDDEAEDIDSESDTGDTYITKIKTAKKAVVSSHRYTVKIETDDSTDLVHDITIEY